MKTMKKVAALLIAGALMTNGASAQKYYIAIEDSTYVITNTDSAKVGNSSGIKLEWYVQSKNTAGTAYQAAQLIEACTTQVCTVPANLCRGDSVRFFRKVTSLGGCTGDTEGFSDTVTVTFKCGGGHGRRIIGGGTNLCWAERNVDLPGAFTATPNDYGRFYQWNKNNGWPSSDPISGWISSASSDTIWNVNPNPCPNGWRLPTKDEFYTLRDIGCKWATPDSLKGNVNNGRFCGPRNASCKLPNNMSGCVFLPASGYRYGSTGALTSQGTSGWYWFNQMFTDGYVFYVITFNNTNNIGLNYYNGSGYGHNIRCVQ